MLLHTLCMEQRMAAVGRPLQKEMMTQPSSCTPQHPHHHTTAKLSCTQHQPRGPCLASEANTDC
jgi:hypothetical protein